MAGGQGPQRERCSHTERGRDCTLLLSRAKNTPEEPGKRQKELLVLKRVGETLNFEGRAQQQGREALICFGVPCACGRCDQIGLDQFEFGVSVQETPDLSK